jgi:hypothetical protein
MERSVRSAVGCARVSKESNAQRTIARFEDYSGVPPQTCISEHMNLAIFYFLTGFLILSVRALKKTRQHRHRQ